MIKSGLPMGQEVSGASGAKNWVKPSSEVSNSATTTNSSTWTVSSFVELGCACDDANPHHPVAPGTRHNIVRFKAFLGAARSCLVLSSPVSVKQQKEQTLNKLWINKQQKKQDKQEQSTLKVIKIWKKKHWKTLRQRIYGIEYGHGQKRHASESPLAHGTGESIQRPCYLLPLREPVWYTVIEHL